MKNKRNYYKKAVGFAIATLFIIGAFVPANGFIVSDSNVRKSSPALLKDTNTIVIPDAAEQNQKGPPQHLNLIDPWWNFSFSYRKEIIIDHTKVAANLTNFPVLLNLSADASLVAHAQSDGDDIVFMNYASGTKLNHEIELYNSSTGQLIVWVNVPYLSRTQDTVLYLYYGNDACGNQENSAETWGSHYRMVQHLSETTGIHDDSTMYGNDGTYYGITQNAVGIIDGADQFVGNLGATGGDYVDCGNDTSLNINDAITVSAWIKPDDQTQWNHICTKGNGDWGVDANRVYQLSIEVNESIDFIINSNQTSGKAMTSQPVPIGSWSYVVGTYDCNAVRVYINGVEHAVRSPFTPQIQNNAVHLRIAARVADALNVGPASYTFDGVIDEVRVSDSALSAAWIATEYNNQQSPTSFSTIGNEEALPPLGWEMMLNFNEPGGKYDNVVFGEKTNASDGRDYYDVPKSPGSIRPFIRALFSTNLTEPYDTLWYEFKHYPDVNKVWNLEVQWVPFNYVSPTTITISWNSSRFNGSEYTSVVLKNMDTGETIDMLHVQSYVFNASAMIPHPFMIICSKLIHVTNPSYGWNFVSLPFNQSFDKTNFVVRYAGHEYSWVNATSGGLVVNFISGWNRSSQSYYMTATLTPGEGYWMYFYYDCELWAQEVSSEGFHNDITHLLMMWNIIGLPHDTSLSKEDLIVDYNETHYNWTQATTNDNPTGVPLILRSIYNWSRPFQNYDMSDILAPGEGYWLYAYHTCTLLRETT